jgi:hypothetical protein
MPDAGETVGISSNWLAIPSPRRFVKLLPMPFSRFDRVSVEIPDMALGLSAL